MAEALVVECRRVIEQAVSRNLGDSLLLSGGLDTTVVAHLSAQHAAPKCFTVCFPLAPAPDIPYARGVAGKLGLKWELLKLSTRSLDEDLVEVIKTLKTFDPMEVRNSVATFHGMRVAKEQGFSLVMTGDAADELFAGYSFIFELGPWEMRRRLRQLWRVMHFSSKPMAAALGGAAALPYLDPTVIRFARKLGPKELVGLRGGRKYGKLILRVAFQETMGARSAWRKKTPIEYGTGTTYLTRYYSDSVGDEAFLRQRKHAAVRDGVEIRDKEQAVYYRIYRRMFPPPAATAVTTKRCPKCGGDLAAGATFCLLCGAYPVTAAEVG